MTGARPARSRTARTAGLLLFAGSAFLRAADVVVLKGGTRIELSRPWVRQGNRALLERSDGTLLSVAVSEIDLKASAAARSSRVADRPDPAVAVSPQTPAEAARLRRDRPKARLRITDADVTHPPQTAPEREKKAEEARSGGPRLEVVDYNEEKTGGNLIVRGELRNSGGAPAINARLTVSALDEKQQKIGSGQAGLSNGLIEPGASVSFSATVPMGEKFLASIRFAPQWTTTSPASPQPAPPLPK